MKTCSKCKKNKTENEFAWKRKKENLKSGVCKTCHSTYAKQHYKVNKKDYIARAKEHNKEYVGRNRIMLLNYLSNKQCVDCGRHDPRVLEFDHINRNNKTYEISEMVKNSLSWETILNEINKCQIRCVLCHRIKTCEENGFYKSKGSLTMDEKVTSLTREQCEFACKMVCQWMNICEDNKRGSSSADVDHSALLRRMLMGGPIHENPPPKRYSYPCWALVEEDEIEIQNMHEYDIDIEGMKGTVVVDQAREYEWVDKENKIIKHTRLGIEYQYSEREVTPDARYLRKGLNPEDHKYTGKFLKRLNDPPTGKEEIWTG